MIKLVYVVIDLLIPNFNEIYFADQKKKKKKKPVAVVCGETNQTQIREPYFILYFLRSKSSRK